MVQLLVGTAPLSYRGGGGGNGTGPGLGDSKEAENPEGNRGLPTRTTPGDGPQASKDARGSSARRRREQERARKESESQKAPTLDDADSFHTALLTPLGDPVLKRLDLPAAVPFGLFSKAYALTSQFNSEVGPGGHPCQGLNQRGGRSIQPRLRITATCT